MASTAGVSRSIARILQLKAGSEEAQQVLYPQERPVDQRPPAKLNRSRKNLLEDVGRGVRGRDFHEPANGGGDLDLINRFIDDCAAGDAGAIEERKDFVR